MPPGRPRKRRGFRRLRELLAGGAREQVAKRSFWYWLLRSVRLTKVVATLAWQWLWLDVAMGRLRRDFAALCRDLQSLELFKLSSQQLVELYDSSARRLFAGWDITLLNDLYAFVFTHLAHRLAGERASQVQTDEQRALFDSAAQVESIEPLKALGRLAELVNQQSQLKESLANLVSQGADHEFDVLQFINSREEYGAFATQLAYYLDHFGDRVREELKLEAKSFREEPLALLQLIATYAAAGITERNFTAQTGQRAAQRRAAIERVFGKRPVRKCLFRLVQNQARRSVRYRESSRLDRARAYGLARGIFRALGAQLQHVGSLRNPEEIWQLTLDEVRALVGRDPPVQAIGARVQQRRELERVYGDEQLPDRIMVSGPIDQNQIPLKDTAPPFAASGQNLQLQGIGCAGGQARGAALVVRSVGLDCDARDKILIAPMTDPGWVFLMAAAKGLVVERGSILSHTAIVGRELGLPTVVGVAQATALIPDGAQVHIDGRSGLVEVTPPQAQAPLATGPP